MAELDVWAAIRDLKKQLDRLTSFEWPFYSNNPGTWTPTVTQGVGVTVTVTMASYTIIGNRAMVTAVLVATSGGTVGNAIKIGGQPAAIQPVDVTNTPAIGAGYVLDSGTAWFQGTVVVYGATDWRMQAHNLGDVIGVTPSFALANNDLISFACQYRI